MAKRLKLRCYNCQELGIHLSRDCPKPKVTRCRCGRTGHIASSCRGVESDSRRTQAKDSNTAVRLINPNNSGYRKVACGANGEQILVYLYTGSECNIIILACVQRIQVSGILPTTTVLRGFSGGCIRARLDNPRNHH